MILWNRCQMNDKLKRGLEWILESRRWIGEGKKAAGNGHHHSYEGSLLRFKLTSFQAPFSFQLPLTSLLQLLRSDVFERRHFQFFLSISLKNATCWLKFYWILDQTILKPPTLHFNKCLLFSPTTVRWKDGKVAITSVVSFVKIRFTQMLHHVTYMDFFYQLNEHFNEEVHQ